MPSLADLLPEAGNLSSDEVLDRFLTWVAELGLELYPAQEEAILELFADHHLILATPTGSGKSLVATALHFKAMAEGQRSIYTAPIKALVNEKFFALCESFGPERVGMQTGDATINPDAPIVCCTAEVLANQALRRGGDLDAPYVVMDEFHYYGDRDRGMAWQIPLLTLPATTFLLMSATLGNTAAIRERLAARSGREVAEVSAAERPVPLTFEYRDTAIHETVESLVTADRAPIYIVHFAQRECGEQAQALTSAKVTDREQKRAVGKALTGVRLDTPYGKELSRFLRHGIGVHHAGLLPRYRRLVERLAQEGLLKVICGTDTLGVGVNIPIRTVLFSRLSKYDGEKVALLTVRDFLQIAGRAGRKGFDDAGWVVAQAPEHVIANRRAAAKAAGKKKRVTKRAAPKGFVTWNEKSFERLANQPPEPLTSRFEITHGLLLQRLQRGIEEGERAGGYCAITELIRHAHGGDGAKVYHRRRAAALFRSLRDAELIQVVRRPQGGGSDLRLADHLQRDFSLHHTLSLFLVEALAELDPDAPDYAIDLLSLVESILEHPYTVLYAQVRRAKGELIARLKAEGMEYDERMERLEEVTYPKPNAEEIYATFNRFTAHHPWVAGENIRPKTVAREMFEGLYTFPLYVRHLAIARAEGVLLRYLSQVYNCLRHTVPDPYKSDAVEEIIAYLRALLETVDASLLEEWEQMHHPGELQKPGAAPPPEAQVTLDPALHPRAFAARVRTELHRLVGALAERDYDDAASLLCPDETDPWEARRIEEALAPYFDDYDEILFTPAARRPHLTTLKEEGPRRWRCTQTLLDPEGDNMWCVECEIALSEARVDESPILRLRRIGV